MLKKLFIISIFSAFVVCVAKAQQQEKTAEKTTWVYLCDEKNRPLPNVIVGTVEGGTRGKTKANGLVQLRVPPTKSAGQTINLQILSAEYEPVHLSVLKAVIRELDNPDVPIEIVSRRVPKLISTSSLHSRKASKGSSQTGN
jgi:hypothetical protein